MTRAVPTAPYFGPQDEPFKSEQWPFELDRYGPPGGGTGVLIRRLLRPRGPAVRGVSYWGWAITMMRNSVMSSMDQRRPSRPRPLSLTPP